MNAKKILVLASAGVIGLSAISASNLGINSIFFGEITANAKTIGVNTSDGTATLNYEVNGNEVEITECSNTVSGALTIPSEIYGDSVTSIGDNAFHYCASLESVAIPNSVTSIGDNAFYYCTSLESVTIPNSIISIGGCVFVGTSLESVTIPNSVASIGISAFSNCTSLESVTISNSVTSIGFYVFSGCKSLESVTIPDSVASIGYKAFSGCTSLESVIIPNSVTSINDNAFDSCSEDLIIYGYTGSYTEEYAEENDITFVALNDDGTIPDSTEETTEATDSENSDLLEKTLIYNLEIALKAADVTGDGVIDATDAVEVLVDYANSMVGNAKTLSDGYGDANADSVVDSSDAVLILKYYAEHLANNR